MTEDGERTLLRRYLDTCRHIHTGFGETIALAARFLPISPTEMDRLTPHEETCILAFLKRYEQFADVLQRTMKAISRILEYGKLERFTSVDIGRRAHSLGILASEKIWADAVRTRNALAHEYPLNAEKRSAQVNMAWESRETLNTTWLAIVGFVEIEGMLA